MVGRGLAGAWYGGYNMVWNVPTLGGQFRCLHTTLWRLSCPFPKKLASHNFVLNKDDKVGNKTANKQERQREKREQERKIEIDLQKRVQIFAFAHA